MFTLNLQFFFLFKVFLSACNCNMKINLSVCPSFKLEIFWLAFFSTSFFEIVCINSVRSRKFLSGRMFLSTILLNCEPK